MLCPRLSFGDTLASIEKRTRTRADGTTYKRFRVRWRTPDGHARSETFKSRKAAEAFATRLEVAEASGATLDPDREDITLAAWADRWLDILAARVATGKPSPTTASGYEQRLRVHILPRLGHHPLRKLTVGHVEQALTAIQAAGSSASTAAGIRRTLSKVLTDAQKHELIDRNVARLADPPSVPKRTPSTFTPDETARIVAGLADVRLGRMFLFVAMTGLRASEARGLKWEHVDLDAGTYTIVRGVHRVGPTAARVAPVGLVESDPKTAGSGQTTPMSQGASDLLREHRVEQNRERLAAPVWHDRGYVFTNRVGGALEPTAVSRVWQRVLADVGVPYRPDPARPGRGLHELRRTFATRLRDAGVPLEDVQALGRWASPAVLLASYSGTSDDRLRSAAQAAADAVLGTST